MSNNEEQHQLHISIPVEVYREMKEIFPEKGMITTLIRRFIVKYISEVRQKRKFTPSPFDVVSDQLIENDVKRGATNGST